MGISSGSCHVPVPVLLPVRGTYSNGSDAEFIRSVSTGGGGRREAAAVDSNRCRQVYLRSYTFVKKRESIAARSRRSLRTVERRMLLLAAFYRRRKGKGKKKKKGCRVLVKKKFMYGSFSALQYVLRRLFS